MKRLITAASFAVFAVPALAAGLPYDQNLVDRALPDVTVDATQSQSSRFAAPYDQNRVDRALPNIEAPRTAFAAAAGNTRSDVEIATQEAATESPWANDYHFIAPAQ
jgi:hypothetical protein